MKDRQAEYENYKLLCEKHGFAVTDFRSFCKLMDEYECEWEVGNYEYEHADLEKPETDHE